MLSPICSASLVSAQKKSAAGNHQVIFPAALCLQKNKRVLSGVNCGVNAISAPFECPIFPVFIDFFIFYFTYFLIIQDTYYKVNRNVSHQMKKSIMAGRYEKAEVPPVPPLLAFDIKSLFREAERGTYWSKNIS